MKPFIPEMGTVIKLQGDTATVMLKGGESCKGCGQAKIGLCKAGSTNMMLTAKNHVGAKVGDSVTVGVDSETKAKGYILAFIIPLFSLIFGALLGHIVAKYFSMPFLDVAAGFAAFFLISFFSLRRLKILDSSSSLSIRSVVSDNGFSEYMEADEFRGYSDCQNSL